MYTYHTATLLLSYGITLLVAVIANALGAIAFWWNGCSYDLSFSSTVSATNNMTLLDERHHPRRGSLPLPEDIEKRLVSLRELDGGGVGFKFDEQVDGMKHELCCCCCLSC